MAVALARILAALHLEDNHLVTFNEWVHNFTYNFCSLYGGGTYLHCTVSTYEQYFLKFNSISSFYILNVVNKNFLALLNLELLTLNFYNCVH